MASNLPKLPSESVAPKAAQPQRTTSIHVTPGEDGWVMRVGRRIEAQFASVDEALDVAVPLARKRSARVFLHLRSGERREMATGEAEELLYQIWKDIHARGTLPIYE